MRQAHHHDGVAVGRRARRLQGPDRGRGAGPVDHQDVLAEALLQALLKKARGLVDRAAGGIGNDQLDRPVGKFRSFTGRGAAQHSHGDRCPDQHGDAARLAFGHGRHDFWFDSFSIQRCVVKQGRRMPAIKGCTDNDAPPARQRAIATRKSRTSSVCCCCGYACGPWPSAGRTPIATAACVFWLGCVKRSIGNSWNCCRARPGNSLDGMLGAAPAPAAIAASSDAAAIGAHVAHGRLAHGRSIDVRGMASHTTGTPISSTATPTSAPSPV